MIPALASAAARRPWGPRIQRWAGKSCALRDRSPACARRQGLYRFGHFKPPRRRLLRDRHCAVSATGKRVSSGGVKAARIIPGADRQFRQDFSIAGVHHDQFLVVAADEQTPMLCIHRQAGGGRAGARRVFRGDLHGLDVNESDFVFIVQGDVRHSFAVRPQKLRFAAELDHVCLGCFWIGRWVDDGQCPGIAT